MRTSWLTTAAMSTARQRERPSRAPQFEPLVSRSPSEGERVTYVTTFASEVALVECQRALVDVRPGHAQLGLHLGEVEARVLEALDRAAERGARVV